ncbi:MAG TPA: CusA/CzcA family heavy metal efflux RND transporter [Gemmataceae bacterium]|nr:CusA/CzcA family heavy metal efflux RND transporter [Gemmataceae bacterium]
MLNWIIDWSLRFRLIVALATIVFVGFGVGIIHSINVDAFPDTTPVQVQINAVAPGLAPEEVERQLTFPVEQTLAGLPRVEQMRSTTRFGLGQVVVNFQDGTDIYFARQLVSERLGALELPEGRPRPKMGPVATGLGEVFHYRLRSATRDLVDLRAAQDWVLRPALRTVRGTAEINSWGGLEKEYQVRVDPDRLIKHGVTFEQVVRAARNNNLNVGGGHLSRSGQRLLISGIARTNTIAQIENMTVAAKDGVPIKVRDLADVVVGNALPAGGVTADGEGPVVLGLGFMLMGENSYAVTNRLKERFEEVKQSVPVDVQVDTLYDRTELVNHVIDTVRANLFEGGLLVVAVLFLFLGNLRAGLIVASAIPLSMLFAFCGMLQFGIAASLLSLGALDFGLVVDSSVVMIENVVRHLSHDDGRQRSRLEIVRDAAIEVRKPTMFGELIIMIVYLPILTLEGIEGKLFRPMALTVIFALVGSLVMSLTLMPVLASFFLPRHMHERKPLVVRLAEWLYAPILRQAMKQRVAVLTLAAASLALAVMVARDLGSEFVPRLSEGALVGTVKRPPDTDLDEVTRLNTLMERIVHEKFPTEVAHVWARCGTGEIATDPMGLEETDFFISLKPRAGWNPEIASQDDLVKRIEVELKVIPGQTLSFSQPIEQRVNEMNSGVRSQVAVKIFGDDLDKLENLANEVVKVLSSIEGASDVTRLEEVHGQPVLQIRIRQEEIARYGVPARDVLDLIESLTGKQEGQVIEQQIPYPLTIWLPERYRESQAALGALLVSTPAGEHIPLARLASLEIVDGPAEITREWGQRRVTVQCNVRDRDIGGFFAEAREKVAEQVELPPGGRYRLEWGGQFENMERAWRRLLFVVPLALLLIFALLRLSFDNLRDVLLVFTGVPFACIGGVAALAARGMPFSISAAIGFIALSGVAVLNSMLLVTFIRQSLDAGKELDEAIRESAHSRVRPVLMTALVASLGFLPMALATSVGAEVQRPLATVVIGGVVSSTAMTLLVLPVLYEMFGSRRPTLGRSARGESLSS